ncbi:hypothetical protein J7M02_02630 [Candidatus Aerophobetes bacterium]|nr:hypothetical protein [Candidatus Aerophobetes bacterium]
MRISAKEVIKQFLDDLQHIKEWEYAAEGLLSSKPDYLRVRNGIRNFIRSREEHYRSLLRQLKNQHYSSSTR